MMKNFASLQIKRRAKKLRKKHIAEEKEGLKNGDL